MCLAVPGRVVGVEEAMGSKVAHVEFGTAQRIVDLTFVPDAGVDDWLIVHSGYALRLMTPAEAEATLQMWSEFALEEGS